MYSPSPLQTTTPTADPESSGVSLVESAYALYDYIFTLPEWQGFVLAVAITLLATVLIGMGMLTVARRVLTQIEGEVDDRLFNHLHQPTYLTVFIAGLYASVFTLGLSVEYETLLRQGSFTFILVLWAQALWRVGGTLTEIESANRYLDDAFLPIFNNLWKVGIGIAAGFGLMTIWGIDVTPLLASAGVMGIAVGFAAKDTIANFFGGVALYFDNTYQKGDYIVLDTGQEGSVIDVGIRSTVLRTREGIRITVPNSVLNNALVTNESAPQKHRRISIPVSVAYGEDIDHVREVLLDVAEAEDLVRSQPPTRVRFIDMGEFSLNLEVRCWVDRPRQRVKATDRLNTAIYKRFNEEDIEIPFPQRDIRFRHE